MRIYQFRCVIINAVIAFASLIEARADTNTVSEPPPAPRRASVILIIADGVGVSDLGCYGGMRIKTPHLDRLAAEGARFTSFYSGSFADGAARASLMLGKDTGHLSIRDDATVAVLPVGQVSLGQALAQANYRSAMFGKWALSDGVGGLPQNHGFEQFGGFLDAASAQAYPEFVRRYDLNPHDGNFDGPVQLHKNSGGAKNYYIADMLSEWSKNYIRFAKPDQFNRYRPFFLMLGYPMPGTEEKLTIPEVKIYAGQSWPETERNRMAAIARMDASIGKVLETLTTRKIETNTIVMFMGTGNRQSTMARTNYVSEDILHVPLIVRWPLHLKPTVVSTPWAAWDILPTLTDNARTDSPTGINGLSFYPTLRSQTQTNVHDSLYWEFHDAKLGSQQAARMGKWKAVRLEPGGNLKLYDLSTDPTEQKDVARENAAVVTDMEKRLKDARTNAERWPLKKPEGKSLN